MLVGVPNPTMTIELPLIDVFGRGGALKSSWYGDCLPSRDFPMLIDLYLQGRLRPRRLRLRDDRARRRRGGLREDAPRRRAALGRGVLSMAARIDKAVVSGVFSLDGQDFDVDNNVWLVGDDDEVLVIDAPHDAAPIVEAIGGRRVTAIVLTHGHNDHITAAVALREATGAPIWFNPADRMLWDVVHPAPRPTTSSPRATAFDVAGTTLTASAHPGPLAGQHLPLRRRPRHGLHRRHAVLRRPGRHRPLLQRPPDDPGVDPRAAADPAGRHRRPHRARRRHDDRRGAVERLLTWPERGHVSVGVVPVGVSGRAGLCAPAAGGSPRRSGRGPRAPRRRASPRANVRFSR